MENKRNHKSPSINEALGWTDEQVEKQNVVYLDLCIKRSLGGYPLSRVVEELAANTKLDTEEKILVGIRVEQACNQLGSALKKVEDGDIS
jgi:hypothetical protein